MIYREVSKAFGFANTFQVLGLVHPHLLVLGMIFILVFRLVALEVFQEGSMLYRISILGYVICEGAASLMLFVRGLINPLVDASVISDIGKMNGMISGLARISRIVLGLFLILIFVSFLRGNKEHNETASLA